MGGVVKGIVGVVKSVVGGVIDTVKNIIKNPLPAIASIALGYFAPGWGSALAGKLGIAKDLGVLAVRSVGSAAITALNGGSMKNILTSALMPVVMSPTVQKSVFGAIGLKDFSVTGEGGILTDNPIINGIGNVLGNGPLANIIKDAAGAATIGGAIALVTGDDIVQSALGAGVDSISSNIVGKMFNTIKSAVTTSDKLAADYKATQTQAQALLDKNPNLQIIAANQAKQYEQAQLINKEIEAYKKLEATINSGSYTQAQVDQANALADKINESLYPKYEKTNSFIQQMIDANKQDYDQLNALSSNLSGISDSYENIVADIQDQYTEYITAEEVPRYKELYTEQKAAIESGDIAKATSLQTQMDEVKNYIKTSGYKGELPSNVSIGGNRSRLGLLGSDEAARIQSRIDLLTGQKELKGPLLNKFFGPKDPANQKVTQLTKDIDNLQQRLQDALIDGNMSAAANIKNQILAKNNELEAAIPEAQKYNAEQVKILQAELDAIENERLMAQVPKTAVSNPSFIETFLKTVPANILTGALTTSITNALLGNDLNKARRIVEQAKNPPKPPVTPPKPPGTTTGGGTTTPPGTGGGTTVTPPPTKVDVKDLTPVTFDPNTGTVKPITPTTPTTPIVPTTPTTPPITPTTPTTPITPPTTPTTPTTPPGGLPTTGGTTGTTTGGLGTTTAPTKVDISTLTPYTGSVNFGTSGNQQSGLGSVSTPTTTPTSTGSTAPQKVDISTLTPVTNPNLLPTSLRT